MDTGLHAHIAMIPGSDIKAVGWMAAREGGAPSVLLGVPFQYLLSFKFQYFVIQDFQA